MLKRVDWEIVRAVSKEYYSAFIFSVQQSKIVLGPADEDITLAKNINKYSVAVAYSVLSFVVVDGKRHRAGQL
jgi:hypothetical protein